METMTFLGTRRNHHIHGCNLPRLSQSYRKRNLGTEDLRIELVYLQDGCSMLSLS